MKKLFLAGCMAVMMLAISIFVAQNMFAQSTTSGDIAGTVTDPSGAVLAGVNVVLKNAANGSTRPLRRGAQARTVLLSLELAGTKSASAPRASSSRSDLSMFRSVRF